MNDLSKLSRVAEQAAYAAGAHLQASRSRLSEVVVTHAEPDDVAGAIRDEAMTLMREVLLRHAPSLPVFEPQEAVAAVRSDLSLHWIVNPLDGRANYLRGHPQYAVALSLVEAGEARVAIVYDPCRNEFFGALKGRGAVLNGVAIHCAAPRPASEALAATVFPEPGSPRMPRYIAECGRVLRGFAGLRRSGSMALELAYLAAGRIDAFWAHDPGACDAGAGALLLRESGARIEARDGQPLIASGSLIACTPALRDALIGVLSPPETPVADDALASRAAAHAVP